jgi:hypothetical protein
MLKEINAKNNIKSELLHTIFISLHIVVQI